MDAWRTIDHAIVGADAYDKLLASDLRSSVDGEGVVLERVIEHGSAALDNCATHVDEAWHSSTSCRLSDDCDDIAINAEELAEIAAGSIWISGGVHHGVDASQVRKEKEGLVEYWGWSANMAATLREVDIVCLPSYREGLPKSLLEASSTGIPVITTDVPGCRDAMIPGLTGIRVPLSSPTDLAQAIQILADSPALREKMGTEGRHFTSRNFSNEVVTSQLTKLYAEVLGKA